MPPVPRVLEDAHPLVGHELHNPEGECERLKLGLPAFCPCREDVEEEPLSGSELTCLHLLPAEPLCTTKLPSSDMK